MFYPYGNMTFKTIQPRDVFSTQTVTTDRVGDVGDKSERYVNRAHAMQKIHDFEDIAKLQNKYADIESSGNPEQEYNEMLRHMVYPTPVRRDGKNQDQVMKQVYGEKNYKIADLLNNFSKHKGWTLNNTQTAVSFADPITMDKIKKSNPD